MAHILILSLVFPPDSVSTAHIMGDLVVDLKACGHTLIVITTRPHYNHDVEAEARQPIMSQWGGIIGQSDYHGVCVYHILMPRKGKSVLIRLLAWLGFHFVSVLIGIFLKKRPNIIIAPSPPLTIGVVAWLLGIYHRAPFIYNVQEIYPDIAISLGALRNPLLINILFSLEKFIYRKSRQVTVIASQMRARLIAKQVEPEKVIIIPNFVDLSSFYPLSKDNDFSRKYGLQNSFVVSYAGNMGPAQQLNHFIEAANMLRQEDQIHFLMMGDGVFQSTLQRQVDDYQLSNFTFLPYQPYSLIPQVYATSNLCLVPLVSQAGSDAVPSKIYRIMACARPILAIADENSDLARLVLTTNCGIVIAPGSAVVLTSIIREAYCNFEEWNLKGQNGCKYVIENYARKSVTDQYNKLIKDVLTV